MEPEEYGRIAAAETGHWWYRNTRAWVAELLAPHLRSGITVLDAGCGPGGNGAWLGSLGTVVGLDREMNALSYVAERHAATRPVRGTVAALPFADATFDVVLSLTVLYSIRDDAQAVSEFARVTKRGGVLVLLEPAYEAFRREHDRTVHGVRRYRVRELRRLVENAGWRVRRDTYAYSFLVPAAAVLAVADRFRHGLPESANGTSSDVERRSFDRLFAALARAETHYIQKHRMPLGLSVIVLAVRD